jgi:hypothetical protein
MKSACVSVWKLRDAPKELQLLCKGLGAPAWIALVPRGVSGGDLDEAMMRNPNTESIVVYHTDNGDVYFGTSRNGKVSEVPADSVNPESARLGSRLGSR